MMKLTVLADNNTFIDQYYCGEPAVSYYIEDQGIRILFDTGYSGAFIYNAQKMGIDFNLLDWITFSHGHNDHTGGLSELLKTYSLPDTQILAHPDTFKSRLEGKTAIGAPVSQSDLRENKKLIHSRQPTQLTSRITWLGEIPESCSFEKRKPIGILTEGGVPDYVRDDTALVYNGEKGLFIITGCSHSGICNIIEYAKQVCGKEKIAGILGGFHLFNINEQVQQTIRYFRDNHITNLYPCHCISFAVKAEIHHYIPIHEVGVGLTIQTD